LGYNYFMQKSGNPYGTHRVLKGFSLPQAAERLDVSLPLYSNEILIQVDRLNVDSTSFRQLWESSRYELEKLKEQILNLVQERGKLHNPVTNSGGMLVGTVAEIGKDYRGPLKAQVGDRIATLVSLTLTPLHLGEIREMNVSTGQISVRGYAILFETGIACTLPSDIPESIALAVLDVCGAPALVLRHVKEKDRVLFMGAGKSAKLSAAALRSEYENRVHITAMDVNPQALQEMKELGLTDEVMEKEKGEYDLVVNVTNALNTEMASILSVREGGKIIFFGMGTSFTQVVLGAEGVGKDATFLMGSGYVKGHAELALNLVRTNLKLRQWFEEKYEITLPR